MNRPKPTATMSVPAIAGPANSDTDREQSRLEMAMGRLREDILSGRRMPGERLPIIPLSEVYAVSTGTLREVLSRLVAQTLVVSDSKKGFSVAPVTTDDIRDVMDTRLVLESHALSLSIRTGDLDWEAAVVAAHYKLSVLERRLMQDRESVVEQWVACDWGFHNATISACRQPVLMRTYASVFDRFARYHMLALNFRGEGVFRDHVALRDLVIERRADEAVDLLTRHIQSGVEHIKSSGGFG